MDRTEETALKIKYDLAPTLAKFFDTHMVLAMLEFVENRENVSSNSR